MNRTRCILVDDDITALAVMENYVKRVTSLDMVAKCENALEAIEVIRSQQIDLMILDIEMPYLTGIDFLKTLNHPPKAIITSANKDYALEGFELNVLDYLIKPVTFERFLKAINRYQSTIQVNPEPKSDPDQIIEPGIVLDYLYVKENKKMVKVLLNEILYIESLKDYIKIFTPSKTIITKLTLSYIEDKFPKDKFLRIHKSFIVSISKIEAFSAASLEIHKKELPIGRIYKDEVVKRLGVEPGQNEE